MSYWSALMSSDFTLIYNFYVTQYKHSNYVYNETNSCIWVPRLIVSLSNI